MFDKLFQLLSEQAVKAANASPVPIDVTKDTFVRQSDGTFAILQAEPGKRDHQAQDLFTVVAFALREPLKSAIWYSASEVVALLDDADRRDTVTMHLAFSPQWLWLASQDANAKQLDQRTLIYTLRTLLRDNLALAGDLVAVLRQINFAVGQAGESNVQRGKSSVGKTVKAEIQGVGELPEYVTLQVPVWTGPLAKIRVRVDLVLEPDEQTQTFKFAPLPGQMDKALVEALETLEAEIQSLCAAVGSDMGVDEAAAQMVRVYRGEP